MKKISVFLLVCIAFSMVSFSQENTTQKTENENFNELKLNGLFLIVGAFDVTYERTLNEESGLGVSVFLPYDDELKEDINFYISPYYRFYFGKKYAAGFFMEGFGMLNSINENFVYDNNFNVISKDAVIDFALGIGLGGKWVTKSGFIGELNFGIGRNLFQNSGDSGDEIVGKIGINLGYRFK